MRRLQIVLRPETPLLIILQEELFLKLTRVRPILLLKFRRNQLPYCATTILLDALYVTLECEKTKLLPILTEVTILNLLKVNLTIFPSQPLLISFLRTSQAVEIPTLECHKCQYYPFQSTVLRLRLGNGSIRHYLLQFVRLITQ